MDTTNRGLASGNEVESAAFHQPVSPTVHTLDRSGLRGKLDDLKWRGVSKLHKLQGRVSERRAVVKQSVATGMTKVQSSMHDSPMKWAGIAAGSGLAIGLLGRLLQVRRDRMTRLPQLVIIESTC